MKILFSILSVLLFLSCKNNSNEDNNSFLEIYYMAPRVSTPYSYSCNMITREFLGDELNYRKVTDKKSVNQFMTMYKAYQTSNDTLGMNIRIKILVHNKNFTDTLCMGENSNTYRNGSKVVDNKQLLLYVKKMINYDATLPNSVKKLQQNDNSNIKKNDTYKILHNSIYRVNIWFL